MTTIGSPQPHHGAVLRLLPAPRPEAPAARPAPEPARTAVAPSLTAPQLRAAMEASGGWLRVGPVSVRSATRYLGAWSAVLGGALVVVFVLGYGLLAALGVVGSVSRTLAILLGDPLPASGVVPALQAQAVLPFVVLLSALVAGLFLVFGTAVVLVHNTVASLVGGFEVRIRPARRRSRG